MDCFVSNFKLKYEDSENVKADRVNTVVFNLHQIKRCVCFLDTRYTNLELCMGVVITYYVI